MEITRPMEDDLKRRIRIALIGGISVPIQGPADSGRATLLQQLLRRAGKRNDAISTLYVDAQDLYPDQIFLSLFPELTPIEWNSPSILLASLKRRKIQLLGIANLDLMRANRLNSRKFCDDIFSLPIISGEYSFSIIFTARRYWEGKLCEHMEGRSRFCQAYSLPNIMPLEVEAVFKAYSVETAIVDNFIPSRPSS